LAAHAGLKFGRERVFVLKASQTLEQRLCRSRSHDQKGHVVAAPPGAIKRKFRAIADWLQNVHRCCRHEIILVAGAERSQITILAGN
jgi:hypothetical protein